MEDGGKYLKSTMSNKPFDREKVKITNPSISIDSDSSINLEYDKLSSFDNRQFDESKLSPKA